MFNSIPTITKNLLIISVLAYAATELLSFQGISLTSLGGLYYFELPFFRFYQFFTYMFLHGSLTHLLFNMFALWMFGCDVERSWGKNKYLFYYLACGVGAGLSQEIVQFLMGDGGVTIGASGAVFGILLAFGMIFPRRIIGIPLLIIGFIVIDLVNTNPMVQGIMSLLNQLFFIAIIIAFFNPASSLAQKTWRLLLTRPIEARYCVAGYIAIELLYSWKNIQGDSVAHMAHVGGMLFGLLIILYWRHQGKAQPFQMNWNFSPKRQQQEPVQPRTSSREADMEYNAEKQQRQEKVDSLLDKIRKSGYESLTKEEKKWLFEASKDY